MACISMYLWSDTSDRARISSRGVATVQEEGLAGHEVRCRRREIDGERSDLFGATSATRGDIAKEAVGDLRILSAEGRRRHVGGEPTRRDRGDLNVVSRPLDAEGAREGDD